MNRYLVNTGPGGAVQLVPTMRMFPVDARLQDAMLQAAQYFPEADFIEFRRPRKAQKRYQMRIVVTRFLQDGTAVQRRATARYVVGPRVDSLVRLSEEGKALRTEAYH